MEGQALDDEQFASLTVCGFFGGVAFVLVGLVFVLLLNERIGKHEQYQRRRWGTLLYTTALFAFDGLFAGSFIANLFAWFFRDVIQNANLLPVYFFSIEGQDIASSVFALAHFSFIGINLLAQGFLVRSVYKHHLLADKEAHPRRRYWFGAATVVLAGAMLFATGLGAIAASAAFSTMLKAPTRHMAIAYLTFSAVAYALSTTVLAFALRRPSTSAKSASDTHGVSSMGSTCSDRAFEKSPRQIRREPSQIDFHPAAQNRPVTSTNGMFVLIQCAVLPTIGAIALLLMLGYAHVDGGGDWHTVGVNVIFAAQAHAMATAPLGMILVQARLDEQQRAAVSDLELGHPAARRPLFHSPLALETASAFELTEHSHKRLGEISVNVPTEPVSGGFPTARFGMAPDPIAHI